MRRGEEEYPVGGGPFFSQKDALGEKPGIPYFQKGDIRGSF